MMVGVCVDVSVGRGVRVRVGVSVMVGDNVIVGVWVGVNVIVAVAVGGGASRIGYEMIMTSKVKINRRRNTRLVSRRRVCGGILDGFGSTDFNQLLTGKVDLLVAER